EIEVEGPEGRTTVTSDASGDWSAEVPARGSYTITLDESTLPEGVTLRDPASNPQQLQAVVGATRQVTFLFGTGTAQTPDGEQPAAPGTGADDPTATQAPAGTNRVVQQLAAGIRFGLVLALASVGLSLIYGTTGLSSFAHGDQV